MSRYLSDAKAHALDFGSAVKILAISKILFIPDVIAKKNGHLQDVLHHSSGTCVPIRHRYCSKIAR